MRYLSFMFGSILFVLLLGFFLKNRQSVEIAYYLGASWHLPLSMLILLSFTAGVIAALFSSLVIIVKQRRALITLSNTTTIPKQHA